MSAAPSKSGKQQQKKKGSSTLSSLATILLITPAVILFFFGGIYVGSQFVHGHGDEVMIGLPNTNNIIRKWGNQHLRGFDLSKLAPPSMHHNLRVNVPEPTGIPQVTEEEVAEAKEAKISDQPHLGAVIPEAKVLTIEEKKDIGVPHFEAPQHLVTGSEMAKLLTPSLHVTDRSFMTAPSNLDNENIIVSAWVYLDVLATENTMRTIFTNKETGCEATEGRNGFSMYVNAWETKDHQLYVEYGGEGSGCYKINSKGIQLIPGRWYHVALSFLERTVSLFIDGSKVNELEDVQPHEVQTKHQLSVGHFFEGYHLHGNVSHLAVVHTEPGAAVTDIVRYVMCVDKIKKIPGLFALYPLNDVGGQVTNSKARDIVGSNDGSYSFPEKTRFSEGLPFPMVDGTNGLIPDPQEQIKSDELGKVRKDKIKEAMQHAWSGYKKYAWGKDEVKPKSHSGQDNWGGMGVTLVDSLDTLLLMGLEKEFKEARDWVEKSLTFNNAGSVSVFETTIRELGGLLAAYDMSGDDVFLNKAKELGDKLLPAFNTASGIPTSHVNLRTGQANGGWSGSSAILSELGSLQLEFRYLSYMTDDPKYEAKSMKAMQVMNQQHPPHGLFPIKVSSATGKFADNMITFGALGDSFYEYLLKIWVQGGRQETWLRDMYDEAIQGVIDVLLKASSPSGLAFLSDFDGHSNKLKMDHLVCFMPATLALGAQTDPLGFDGPRAQRDLALAKGLMYTCREMYHRQPTGIAPEFVEFRNGQDMVASGSAYFYILRPETVESLFYLEQITSDPIYREWSWEIFEAIEKYCKTDDGYGALRDVRTTNSGTDDRMESFFLAETLKYLYLIQDPDEPISLRMHVFNTEAHPLRVFEKHQHKPVMPL
eukprot:CAMPEP_0182422000 /NCGR_PEP_ID=MMETSP1167-20130531/7594_1 /TAXON_ID=2988 /ORGANISM="Mallomonas Sp, Strain CCMP3275" /LENGTH=874 /DNA_ID=CAMNT_0024599693 /DNA_START=38 /DNA_END=2662 /DNA_ORIENTATION=+